MLNASMIMHASGRAVSETTLVANVAVRGRLNVIAVTHECRCHESKRGTMRTDILAHVTLQDTVMVGTEFIKVCPSHSGPPFNGGDKCQPLGKISVWIWHVFGLE